MSEATAIEKTSLPRTRESLAQEFVQAGLARGVTVIVHSSLSSLGWVCGGPVAVVQALMDVVTDSGTIVMPTHTGDYSDPAEWQHPPVPSAWWQIIRENMPIFDPRITPTRGMGQIVEVFRICPGVLRSAHPEVSFAAWGRDARRVTDGHALDYPLGEQSPLARIYDLNGSVLLLGVGYDCNTSFHLAEYRAPGVRQIERGAPIVKGQQRTWKVYSDIALEDELFVELGSAFEQTGQVTRSRIGSAEARLFSQRHAVDFAVGWLAARRASVEI